MSKIIRNIAYSNKHDERNLGDLLLPVALTNPNPVLLIHGGGWNALSKESFEPWAKLFNDHGRAVFNINYRLLRHAPWPACLQDCLAAANYILSGALQQHGIPGDRPLLICGGSAGGHLTMMTGLNLDQKNVEAMISISGPAVMDFPDGSTQVRFASRDYTREFFGDDRTMTDAEYAAISPPKLARADAPPLFCIHSRNDKLVPESHSIAAVNAWREKGIRADCYLFDGPGESHGIWDSEDHNTRQPIAGAAKGLYQILNQLDRVQRAP